MRQNHILKQDQKLQARSNEGKFCPTINIPNNHVENTIVIGKTYVNNSLQVHK
jgi:hypothetical protein